MEAMKHQKLTYNDYQNAFDCLPDELVLIILSNLDFQALCRFAATCRRILHLLSQLRFLSISLPLSPLRSESALRRYLYSDSMDRYSAELSNAIECSTDQTIADYAKILYQHFNSMLDNSPSVSESSDECPKAWCLSRFTNLESLEVRLPASCLHNRSPKSFWWDVELHGTIRPKGHIAIVIAILVDGLNRYFAGEYVNHIMLHWLIAKLLLSKVNSARSIVTKFASDDEKGCLRLHRDHQQLDETGLTENLLDWLLSERRMRRKVCLLPTLFDLNNEPPEVQKTLFCFISWVEEDDTTHVNDVIKTSLRLGINDGDDDYEKALKDIVTEVLTHDRTAIIETS